MAADLPSGQRELGAARARSGSTGARWAALGAVVLLAAGTAWNGWGFDRREVAKRILTPEVIALPRPEVVRHLAMGFDAVLADLYWIGAVHYLGESRYKDYGYAQLVEYIDVITALAPDLHEAYWFGGVAAPWNTGKEWVNVDGAVRTFEAGLRRFPDDWRMRMALAYDYAAYQHRLKDAGEQLRLAATAPGAPRYLASLSTRMFVSADDLDGAISIARHLYESSEDPAVKAAMQQRVRELRELADVKALQAAVDAYRAAHGQPPPGLEALQVAIPADPGGGAYAYDAATGQVSSAHLSRSLTAFGIQ